MKKTIWKFPLEIIREQNLMMPEGAEILSVQTQHNSLCLWALVNPEAPLQRRVIEVFGTGHSISDAERKYVTTAQRDGGKFVWHIFEKL